MDLHFKRDILKPIIKICAVTFGSVTILGTLASIPVAILTGVILLVVASNPDIIGDSYQPIGGSGDSTNRILVIPVKGEINGEPFDSESIDPNMAYGYTIADQLAAAEEDDSVKAVVLSIDSPGGTIYGARAITTAVEHYRQTTKRPVVAYVGGSADSGAYWSAASSDLILADYGTNIGSIGVIIGPIRRYTKVTSLQDPIDGQVMAESISMYNITAGFGKDEGDPYRDLSAREKANLQQGVDNDYATFVQYIATRRNLTGDTLRTKIGALTYDPQTALSLGLIDGIMGRDEAYARAAKLAKLSEDDYEIVGPPASTLLEDGWTARGDSADQTAAACKLRGRLAIAASSGCYNK